MYLRGFFAAGGLCLIIAIAGCSPTKTDAYFADAEIAMIKPDGSISAMARMLPSVESRQVAGIELKSKIWISDCKFRTSKCPKYDVSWKYLGSEGGKDRYRITVSSPDSSMQRVQDIDLGGKMIEVIAENGCRVVLIPWSIDDESMKSFSYDAFKDVTVHTPGQ